ncbi:MAG: class I SAM-dependent methyltransferase, partial [Hyphomicrobiales bacterium]|nr:class I SAM-dependent methyltransferase [Hyphomicrobiales bacterium]
MARLFDAFFDAALSRFLRVGDVAVTDCKGRTRRFGDGSGPPVVVRFVDAAARWRLLANPELAFGDLYMDGRLVLERGDLYDLVALGARNVAVGARDPWQRVGKALRRLAAMLAPSNDRRRARDNVRRHYDIGDDVYALFLDEDWQYSCAYFERANLSLEDAQRAKKRHVAAKLLLKPGMKTLDIGSGWGGLGLYLAEMCGSQVTGVTLSTEQLARARRRAQERGLGDRADFRLQDYRDLSGAFDRIVSV